MRSIQQVYSFTSPNSSGYLVGEFHIELDEQDGEIVDSLLQQVDLLAIEGEHKLSAQFDDSNPYYLKNKQEIDGLRQKYIPGIFNALCKRVSGEQHQQLQSELDNTNPYFILVGLAGIFLVEPEKRTEYAKSIAKQQSLDSSMLYAEKLAGAVGKKVCLLETLEEKVDLFWSVDAVRESYEFLSKLTSSLLSESSIEKLKKFEMDKDVVIKRASYESEYRDGIFADRIDQLTSRSLIMLGAGHIPRVKALLDKRGYKFVEIVYKKE